MNTDGMRAIDELVRWHREQYRTVNASRPYSFAKRQRKATHDAKDCPQRAKRRFRGCWTHGHLATHSLRKSFAQRLYEQTGDVFTVQEMLGHKSIATTQKYLGVNYASVREALQKMSLDGELHERNLLGNSLNPPQTNPVLELALRGTTSPVYAITRRPPRYSKSVDEKGTI